MKRCIKIETPERKANGLMLIGEDLVRFQQGQRKDNVMQRRLRATTSSFERPDSQFQYGD